MKFWFTKKTPKDVYDVKAPYDATVEQMLRVAQEVNATPVEADREVFDFAKAFRDGTKPAAPAAEPPPVPPVPAMPRPTVSRAMRDEMEQRTANYRAFQVKLNDQREARIRRTMDEVRATLKQQPKSGPAQR